MNMAPRNCHTCKGRRQVYVRCAYCFGQGKDPNYDLHLDRPIHSNDDFLMEEFIVDDYLPDDLCPQCGGAGRARVPCGACNPQNSIAATQLYESTNPFAACKSTGDDKPRASTSGHQAYTTIDAQYGTASSGHDDFTDSLRSIYYGGLHGTTDKNRTASQHRRRELMRHENPTDDPLFDPFAGKPFYEVCELCAGRGSYHRSCPSCHGGGVVKGRRCDKCTEGHQRRSCPSCDGGGKTYP
jgi:DnaJ-class molecular chaperone